MQPPYHFTVCNPSSERRADEAVGLILRRHKAGKTTTTIVQPPRTGKSDVARLTCIEGIETNVFSLALILSPWVALRDQIKKPEIINKMRDRHKISLVVDCDKLPGPIPADFLDRCMAQEPRHFWSGTIQTAQQEANSRILCGIGEKLKAMGLPRPIVFVDESHYLATGPGGWGGLALELEEAGWHVVLLTGTPYRSDNLMPYGFQMEEVEHRDVTFNRIREDSDGKRWADKYQAARVRYKVVADFPMGFEEAWNKGFILKSNCRRYGMMVNGSRLDELSIIEARKTLSDIVRNRDTMKEAVTMLVEHLWWWRQQSGFEQTAAIVYTGNDNDDRKDWHAREIKRLFEDIWKLKTRSHGSAFIATLDQDGSGDKAAGTIGRFADETAPQGECLIVKNMGGVGLDVQRIKVVLDLSSVRTLSAILQRWLRGGTIWEGREIGKYDLILPNDALTNLLYKQWIEDKGGSWTTEDEIRVGSVLVKPDEKTKQLFQLGDFYKDGAKDQSLREIDETIEEAVSWVKQQVPKWGYMHTDVEIANLMERGIINHPTPEQITKMRETVAATTSGVRDFSDEVSQLHNSINSSCKALANQEATYNGGNGGDENNPWIDSFKSWMVRAKIVAGFRGELRFCRNISQLKAADEFLKAELAKKSD